MRRLVRLVRLNDTTEIGFTWLRKAPAPAAVDIRQPLPDQATMSTTEIRAWCRAAYGADWWQREKASRKREAKAALGALAGGDPNTAPNADVPEEKQRASAGTVPKARRDDVIDESRTWSEHETFLRAKYGVGWDQPDPDPDGTPARCYLQGLPCDRAFQRLAEARDAVAQTPLSHDFDTKLQEASVVAREFIAYAADTRFKETACFSCHKEIKAGHLYLVDFLPGRKRYRSGYTVGCSHVHYDGEEWCDSCCTIMRVKDQPVVQCTRCAQIDWGRPCANRDYWGF